MSRYIGPVMLLVGVVAGADSSGTVIEIHSKSVNIVNNEQIYWTCYVAGADSSGTVIEIQYKSINIVNNEQIYWTCCVAGGCSCWC